MPKAKDQTTFENGQERRRWGIDSSAYSERGHREGPTMALFLKFFVVKIFL